MATARLLAALRLLLLVAVIWQGFVTQTHSHAPAHETRISTASNTTESFADTQRGDDDAQADCPTCRISASAGAYLVSVSIALVLRPAAAIHYRATLPIVSSPTERRHNWRSRAPPAFSILPTA